MKKHSFFIFFFIIFTVYGLVNFYIFITGWHAIPASYNSWYLVIFFVLSLSYFAGRFLEKAHPGFFSTILIWLGSFWMAAMVYFLFSVILIDLLRLVNFIIPFIPKDNFALNVFAFRLIILIVFIVVLIGYLNARSPRIKNLALDIPKKANGLK